MIQKTVGSGGLETVQETLARYVLQGGTIAGLAVLLGSCFRRNDEYSVFAQSRKQESSKTAVSRRRGPSLKRIPSA